MGLGLMKCWATSALLLALTPVFASDNQGGLTIQGRVIFMEDQEPFSGAVVELTELRGRLFMKPAVIRQLTDVSDANGRFIFELSQVRGTLDVWARHKECLWSGSLPITLSRDDWRGKEVLTIELEASRGQGLCSEAN